MTARDIPSILREVIVTLLAQNTSHVGAVGAAHYGLEVVNVTADGSEFELNLTFKSGMRYCCIESECHIPINAIWFRKLRDGLRSAGVDTPPLVVRQLHVIVEQGVLEGAIDATYTFENRLEYESGPYRETDRG